MQELIKPSEKLLSIENLGIYFAMDHARLMAVDGANFSLKKGETVALVGESGCGKSLTALSIMQLLPPNAHITSNSKISLAGSDLLQLPEVLMRKIRGRRMAMIFQEPMTSLNPVLTIGDQIAEGLRCHMHLNGNALQQRVIELLDAVGLPAPKLRMQEYPHQLSGGMKQRVMIAIALAGQPDLLIADEPTTALDVTIQAQVLQLLRDLQKQFGMALLLITHDLGIVREMAQRVCVMYAGHIIEQADCKEFFKNPAHPYSRKLFDSLPNIHKRTQRLAVIKGNVPGLQKRYPACRFVDRCEYAWDLCHNQTPPNYLVAREHHARCHLYAADLRNINEMKFFADEKGVPAEISKTVETENLSLLQVQQLKVYFPIYQGIFKRVAAYVKAVDGVDLTLRAGKTVALIGESGCGKTTIGKAILRLLPVSGGSIKLGEHELILLSPKQLRGVRAQLQIIFQDPYSSLNPRMLVRDIIAEGLIALRQVKNANRCEQRIDELLTQVGLPLSAKYRYPHEFSGGQRQRICIARALAVNPHVLICDEPTSALDVSVQAQILNLLKELQQRLGLAYLFITHNISVVGYLADEIAIMYLGRIVEQGRVQDVLEAPKHPYTQALLSAVPVIDKTTQRSIIKLTGEMPSPANPPTGCHFHPRCPHVMELCRREYPGKTQFNPDHFAKCFLYSTASKDEILSAPSDNEVST